VVHDRQTQLLPGALALFCPACPQSGLNIPPETESLQENRSASLVSHVRDTATNVLTRLLYRPQIVVDGNMKLVHFQMKCPEADVSLSDGKAFMVERGPYEEHLANAPERQPVCNPPLMVSRSFNSRGDVEIPMS